MKNKDTLLLEAAYREVLLNEGAVESWHQTRWFTFHNVDPEFAMGVLGGMDGIELTPDDDYEGQEDITSGTIRCDIDEFPESYKKLLQFAKEGKIKESGGPGFKNMTGRATRVR